MIIFIVIVQAENFILIKPIKEEYLIVAEIILALQ